MDKCWYRCNRCLRRIWTSSFRASQGCGNNCDGSLVKQLHSEDSSHKQGCPALGGYGTPDRTCICKPHHQGGKNG